MKVIFMGTSEFAVPALRSIHNSSHKILGVFTKPPARAMRGHHLQKSPVHEAAESLALPVTCPTSLKDEETLNLLRALEADIIVVAAYGNILRPAVLNMYQHGCLNIHPSKLPRWRGAAPIERTILAGDEETELCIIQMDAGLDTGDILLSQKVKLTGHETSRDLTQSMGELGGKMIVKALNDYDNLTPRKQSEDGITYAHKLLKDESLIDWTKSAQDIEKMIRAFSPWPGCSFHYNGESIKILAAQCSSESHQEEAGTVIDNKMNIACKTGILHPTILQKAGKKAVAIKDFLNGTRIPKGTILK